MTKRKLILTKSHAYAEKQAVKKREKAVEEEHFMEVLSTLFCSGKS